MDFSLEMTSVISKRPDIHVRLTLSALAKSADLTHVVTRFQTLGPSGLLFTQLDETARSGNLVCEAVRESPDLHTGPTLQSSPWTEPLSDTPARTPAEEPPGGAAVAA